MADYAYLRAAKSPTDLAGAPILARKYDIATAWLLCFAADEVAAPNVVACKRTTALARLRAVVIPPSASTLRALMIGLIGHLEAERCAYLVVDARAIAIAPTELRDRIAAAPRISDEPPWELEEDDLGDDEESVYVAFGEAPDGYPAWLRPPRDSDDDRLAMVAAAFADFARVGDPVVERDELVVTYTRGKLVVAITIREGDFVLVAKRRSIVKRWQRSLWSMTCRTSAQLAAWGRHLAEHGSLLEDVDDNAYEWWTTRAGAAFLEKLPALPEDVAAITGELPALFLAAIAKFTARPDLPPRTLDLGARGHLRLEHVRDPGLEPHVRATIARGAGDPWFEPFRERVVPPAMQRALAAAFVAELATLDGGVVVGPDRFEPERFVAGFVPPRMREDRETVGVYSFVGEKLIVITSEGARTTFKFDVPKDLDRKITPYVSGWWTANGGGRFASVLRIGDRTWRFDNEGKLLR